jgi:glycosyltransferase involved in cell wall biosynthesis
VHRGKGIKGHDVLLGAWRKFVESHPNSKLILIGGGFDRAGERYREELIGRFGVESDRTIIWLPTVTDVRRFYAAADVSVSPSLSENHGAALEAGSMGLPSIVSDAGALPEAVCHESGWVVRRSSVTDLLKALADAHNEHAQGHLSKRGHVARRRAEKVFDDAACARKVADVLELAAARSLLPAPRAKQSLSGAFDGPGDRP